ncbi:hypothetical protein [Emticicia aquatica]|nr:hypothetical protein [Emticicia aquatica]
MATKNSLKSMLHLSNRTKSIIILLLIACGPMPFDYDEFKSFFSPESAANEAKFRPYNFTTQFTYDSDVWTENPNIDAAQIENVKAWAKYAGISEAVVSKELYVSYDDDTHKTGLSDALKNKGKTEALAYLDLAKQIEAIDNGNFDDAAIDTNQQVVKPDFDALLMDIQAKHSQTKDIFLKERLAYQAVKVADLAENPKKSIELYEKLVKPIAKKTFISDWATSRMAGACMHAGDTTKAYYLFSQLFINAPTRQSAAYLSLKYSPRFHEEALKLCQNDTEKANVYAATAVLPFQDGLPMLEKMRDLDAKNPLIEFVMAREINKNEKFFFSTSEEMVYTFWGVDSLKKVDWKANAHTYFEKLLAFNLESAEKENLKDSPFWYTAASYLAFIGKDLEKANELLQKAKAIPTNNQGIKDQIAIQEMIFLVNETPDVTPKMEAAVIPLLERFARSDKFRTANNFNATCKILAAKYEGLTINDEFSENQGSNSNTSQKTSTKTLGWFSSCFGKKEVSNSQSTPENVAKAFIMKVLASYQQSKKDEYGGNASFLSNTDQYAIEDSTSSQNISYVIDYFSKKSTNDFDKRLQKLAGFNNDYLYMVLGRRALAEHRYTEAANAWQHIDQKTWQNEPFQTYLDVNPFSLNGQGDADAEQKVTPLSFATRMASLETKVKQNPNDSESWLLLGCGTYNMSYYGNSWILLRRAWSSYEKANTKDDYYTYDKALFYFDKAMKTSPKPELAAKACYLAATCQQIKYNMISAKMYDGLYLLPEDEITKKEAEIKQTLANLRKENYSIYFNLLKTKYGSTTYEEQLIDECSTYQDYLAGK